MSDVQIKICGLTSVKQALECVRLGADAIGMVFFPPSPRDVSAARAQEICEAVGETVSRVGVFVDMDPDEVADICLSCGINVAQLHGDESPEDVLRVKESGLKVVKALKDERFPEMAKRYEADAFLLELGKGALPGGNGQPWDFSKAADFGKSYPFLLAGGLNLQNVCESIHLACPSAVDVSSAVEQTPGIKDLGLVEKFIHAVKKCDPCCSGLPNIF